MKRALTLTLFAVSCSSLPTPRDPIRFDSVAAFDRWAQSGAVLVREPVEDQAEIERYAETHAD